MKKFDLGQTIGILANIGVLAGIIFLAIEVSQQNTINLLTGRDAAVEHFNGARTLLLENPDLMQIWIKGRADEPLSEIEAARFQLLCQNEVWGRLTIFNRQIALSLDEEAAGAAGGLRNQVRESERVRDCWNAMKRNVSRQGYEDFVDLVDSE